MRMSVALVYTNYVNQEIREFLNTFDVNENDYKNVFYFTFRIEKVSRALLQELARHRVGSLSVESSRYVLGKKIKNAGEILEEIEKLKKEKDNSSSVLSVEELDTKISILEGKLYQIFNECYCLPLEDYYSELLLMKKIDAFKNKFTGEKIEKEIKQQFLRLAKNYDSFPSNDALKYLLGESFLTNLTLTISLSSLMNFLRLRTSKSALWEIRILAKDIFKELQKIRIEDDVYLEKDLDEIEENLDFLSIVEDS